MAFLVIFLLVVYTLYDGCKGKAPNLEQSSSAGLGAWSAFGTTLSSSQFIYKEIKV